MKNFLVVIVVVFVLASCSTNSQLIYLKDTDSNNFNKVDYSNLRNNIEPGDILKIDVQTIFPEAALPYNIPILNSNFSNLQVLKLEG